ncbi:UNVERIFIED_CONTAM: Dynein heavy chain 11, axonemal [Gekko kuhli]
MWKWKAPTKKADVKVDVDASVAKVVEKAPSVGKAVTEFHAEKVKAKVTKEVETKLPIEKVGMKNLTEDTKLESPTEIIEVLIEEAEVDIPSEMVDAMVKNVLDEILEKLPEEYNMIDIMQKSATRTPYILVCFQECERMNILVREIWGSLKQLDLGLKGELTFSPAMEALQSALFFDLVPDTWSKLAYPSTYSLPQWFNDLLMRCRELDTWTQDLVLPAVVWLSGFFNPQSFLTGARWDIQTGAIAEARLKDLTSIMPVIFVRAIPVDRQETKHIYKCPVYKTKNRGPTYVWTFNLKTKVKPAKWVLAGVALLLAV